MKTMPPRYLINPLATGAILWAPQPHQLVLGYENPSKLNSVWLGTIYSALTFPERFFWMVLVPIFNFSFIKAAIGLLALLFGSVMMVLYGLTMRLRAIPLEIEVASNSFLLPKAECRKALNEGYRELVMDLNEPIVPGTAASLDK